MFDPEPWERLKAEKTLQYGYFQEYLSLGYTRTLQELSKQTGFSLAQIRSWAKKYQWDDRAAAWDQRLAMVRRQGEEKMTREKATIWAERQEALREEEWEMRGKLKQKAEEMLKYPLAQVKHDEKTKTTIINPTKWTASDAARLAIASSQLGRLSAELETSRQKVEQEVSKEVEALFTRLEQHLPADLFNQVLSVVAGQSESDNDDGKDR